MQMIVRIVYIIFALPFFLLGLLIGVVFDVFVFGFNEGMDMWGIRK